VEVPKHEPDVALMDIHLPDESGIACTARLTGMLPSLQVIMVTVYKDTDLIFQALKAGACGYILKRFRPEEILQAIAEVRTGGAPMTPEIARMVVRSFRAPSAVAEVEGLTAREAEILTLLAEGLSNKEIAQKSNITAGTVRIHLGNIFKKLHVRCRTEAAAKYFRTKQGASAATSE
jgi:DNA-binding NarL/FixJ family response regulator